MNKPNTNVSIKVNTNENIKVNTNENIKVNTKNSNVNSRVNSKVNSNANESSISNTAVKIKDRSKVSHNQSGESKLNSLLKIKNADNEEKIQLTNYNKEEDKSNSEKKGTIVAKIDNIYMSIKDVPPYFTRLRILLFLYSLFNLSFLWILLATVGPIKNNYYCLDPFSRDFKVCDQIDFCDNTHHGIKYIVFSDSPTFTNKTVLQELYNINNNFLHYFLKDGILFSLLNTKFDKYIEVDSLYSIVFAVTTNEKWNIYNAFNQYCNKQIILVEIACACFISTIVGNIVMGFISDVYGRRKVLVFVGIKQFCGCLLVFILSTWIISTGTPSEGSFENNAKSFTFDYRNETEISSYINYNHLQSFESQNINEVYKTNFNANVQMYINSQIIANNFAKYKLFIFFGLAVVFASTSAGNNISLAYLLENSINDTDIYYNYNFWNYCIPLSYLFHFILMSLIGNFHLPFLICGICVLITVILIAIFGYESPRHNYEFFEYKEITKFFESILDKELLRKFYKTEEHTKFRKELSKQTFKISFWDVICNNIMFLGYKQKANKYKEQMMQSKFQEVRRYELIKNPTLMFVLMRSNKHLKQHMLIIVSLVANIGLIFFLTVSKFNQSLVYSRESLYTNIIVNHPIFYLCLVMCLSLYFFNFILKFFGYNIILFICFAMIFIFSLLFELLSLGSRNPEDMNLYVFNSIEIIFSDKGSSLLGMLFIVTFFATGIYCTIYFYLTKLTKTLYRCTFYGLFHVIIDATTIFSLALSQYFEKNYFYVSVLSVIGFVNAYFIKEDVDFSLVGDFRKIELEEDEDD